MRQEKAPRASARAGGLPNTKDRVVYGDNVPPIPDNPPSLSHARKLVRKSDLNDAERLIMGAILDRVHNQDCQFRPKKVPYPTYTELGCEAPWKGKPRSGETVRRVLKHLQEHGWIWYAPPRGRGNVRTVIVPFPYGEPQPCDCGKVHSGVDLSKEEKSTASTPKSPQRDFGSPSSEGSSPLKSHLEGEEEPQPESCTRIRIDVCRRPAIAVRLAVPEFCRACGKRLMLRRPGRDLCQACADGAKCPVCTWPFDSIGHEVNCEEAA